MTSPWKKFSARWVSSLVLVFITFASARAADESGSFYINEALVHYIRPENGRQGVSVVMVPGLNLSSYIYLTTPDGRPGWAQEFANDGYDVYVINDPNFDFSRGFNVTPFTNVPTVGAPPADPNATQSWQQDIWRRWGFGSSQGNPYPDTRFPTAHFGAFASNYPYLRTGRASYSNAIIALLDQIGPSLLMAHSAGGPQAISAAKARPNLVPALILIEPTSPPGTNDFPALSGMSLIGVYGDYIDSRNQGNRKIATESAATLHIQNGGLGEVVSLPEKLGIFGNTHLMMQDNNSALIADLILNWLAVNPISPSINARIPSFGLTQAATVPYRRTQLHYFARKDNPSHFFSSVQDEVDNVNEKLSRHFDYQGVNHWVVANYTLNAVPVYRMYNRLSGAHFYTASRNEVLGVMKNLRFFSLEGISFFVFLSPEPGTMPVYRFWVPETASHYFTISEAEKNALISSGQQVRIYEGIAWYAYPTED